MAKVVQTNVTAKLRNKNIFLLFGFFLLLALGWLLLPYLLALGLLSIGGSGLCLWLLVTPSVRWLPPTRHDIVSLDVSGASKSIRLVRTNEGLYCPCIFTPKSTKELVQKSVNTKLQKVDGTVKLSSDIVQMPTYTNTGNYQKIVLEGFEFTLPAALVVYACLIVRSDKDTIFDAVSLRKYLGYLQTRLVIPALFVRVVLAIANVIYFSFLLNARFKTPTPLEQGGNGSTFVPNTVVVSENLPNVKGVGYAN